MQKNRYSLHVDARLIIEPLHFMLVNDPKNRVNANRERKVSSPTLRSQVLLLHT